MKTLETKRDRILIISVFIILTGIIAGGIFGIVLALLFISITGTLYGIYKKEKRLWRPLLISSTLIIAGIISFIILLLNSDM